MRNDCEYDDTTSEQLLEAWQNEGIGRREIKSHRAPSVVKTRHTLLVAATVIGLTAAPLVMTNEQDDSARSSMSMEMIDLQDDPVEVELEDRKQHVEDETSRLSQRQAKPMKSAKPSGPARVNPAPGSRISSCYGPRWGKLHKGMDFAAPHGKPIVAAEAGVVVQAGWQYSGLGYSVVIKHDNGWMTLYGHASKVLVGTGQRVSAGDRVALIGSTGHSTGNHLHFGVAKTSNINSLFNSLVNPAPWLTSGGVKLSRCI